jgi:thiamine biosynthesis lipoprotein
MAAGIASLPAQHVRKAVAAGSDNVAVADRDALGTTARLAFWPAARHAEVVGAVDRVLAALDLQASRFRPDSEISAIHAAGGGRFAISAGLAEAISVALAAAQWTTGLVDPTVGGALCALGYDRDFAQLAADSGEPDEEHGEHVSAARIPGWRAVRLAGQVLDLPAGVQLDLGATGKGLGADRASRAAYAATRAGGVLVSLGGDMAMAGRPPAGGWPVLIADDHRHTGPGSEHSPVQLVRIATGALATSSVSCRQWQRAGQRLHHIVDPRTGLPAAGPWRTVSVAAATCAAANAAATAAIVAGADAMAWLAGTGLSARLVASDGSVTRTGGWPAGDGGLLPSGPAAMPDLASFADHPGQ